MLWMEFLIDAYGAMKSREGSVLERVCVCVPSMAVLLQSCARLLSVWLRSLRH